MRALVVALVCAAAMAHAAPPGEEPLAKMLAARVTETGEVAYRTLARDDGRLLRDALDGFARVDANALDTDGTIAFWINAYHLIVLDAVAHGATPETLPGRARMYHWYGHTIAGKRRTLDEILGTLHRYAVSDPRIHLALCNGARGSAPMPAEPYTAERLDAQLAAAARRFVNDVFRTRAGPDRVDLSRIFAWYTEDFQRDAGSIGGFLQRFAERADLRAALSAHVLEIHYLPFDWHLNAVPGEQPE